MAGEGSADGEDGRGGLDRLGRDLFDLGQIGTQVWMGRKVEFLRWI